MATSARINPSIDCTKTFVMGIEGVKEVSDAILGVLSPVASPYGRVSIENRPAIVQSRKRVGDIEVDLMMGKN